MSEMPVRVQLSRRKGWKMPPNTVSVARPGRWGNPFRVGQSYLEESGLIEVPTAKVAARLFREWIEHKLSGGPALHSVLVRSELSRLRGKNLACWCKLGQPCHADVLLELANRPSSTGKRG